MTQRPSRAPHPDPEPRWTLDPRVRHLNHGSFGAVPEAVQAEQARLLRLAEWNPVRWFASLPERIAQARHEMARKLRVHPSSMAFVINASAGASVVYQSLMDRGPVHVLATDHGYGAITMGAERLARRTGGALTVAEVPLAASPEEVVAIMAAAIAESAPTLLVIDQVTSATARAFPVDDICRIARQHGVLTLVDGAHAPGVLPEPVCAEADYWVGNLHKFACSPRGAAVLVARAGGQELFPLIDSWGARLPFPERFDHNGTMDVTPWLTAPFAWQHIEDAIGWDEVRRRASDLLDEAIDIVAASLEGLTDTVVPDVGQAVGPMRLLGLPGTLGSVHSDADALRVPFSDATGIAAAFTNFKSRGYLRLSAHAYNSIHDYEYLATVGIPLLHQWSRELVRGTSAS